MAKVADKIYVDAEGNESRSASPEAVALLLKFSNGEEIRVDRDKVPANVASAAMLHGLSQKIGDTYAGAENIADAVEKAGAMAERLLNGEWLRPRESVGPRIGLLVEAVVAAKTAAGMEADAEKIAENLKGNADLRKNALNNPQIKAEYDRIKAERAQAAAKASAKEARGAETTGLEGF